MKTRPAWILPALVLFCGGLVLALSVGIRQTFGLFLTPMSIDLGWGRETFALAIAVQQVVFGVTHPLFGAVADRWGAGRAIMGGAAVYALGLYMMSVATTPLAIHLGAGLLVGIGLSGTGFAVIFGAIGRAFAPRWRSAALGIASAVCSFGQFVMVPIGQALIDSYGWPRALSAMALLAAVMIVLAPALAGRPVREAGTWHEQSFGAALREAFRHSGYRYLNAGFFVCGFHVTFIATHLPAYLTDRGLSVGVAANALALVGLLNIVGSFAYGVLGGRYSKKYLLTSIYISRSMVILAFLMAPTSAWSAYFFAGAMGLLWLGTVPLTSGLVAQIFGPRYLGTLFGIVTFSHQIGAFLGAWLGGYLFDATGSYDAVWWIAILLGVAAALLHLPIREQAVMRRPVAE